MLLTLELPQELAIRLHPFKNQLPHLLELGLKQTVLNDVPPKKDSVFNGINDILEFLAKLPTPEEIIALRPAESLQQQVNDLLEKQRAEGLTADEEQQWQQYEYLEHLVRIAKSNALLKLNAAQ